MKTYNNIFNKNNHFSFFLNYIGNSERNYTLLQTFYINIT